MLICLFDIKGIIHYILLSNSGIYDSSFVKKHHIFRQTSGFCIMIMHLHTWHFECSDFWSNNKHQLKHLSCLWFEVFTPVKIQVEVFWVVTLCSNMVGYHLFRGPCCFHLKGEVYHLQHYMALQSEDGGSKVPWNVGILPQHHTASQPRRLTLNSPYLSHLAQCDFFVFLGMAETLEMHV
jgi:hypothetical protein